MVEHASDRPDEVAGAAFPVRFPDRLGQRDERLADWLISGLKSCSVASGL
jgi:hypothetical protein